MRSLLEGLGLVQVGCEGTTSIMHGSEPSTLFQRAILPMLQPLVSAGALAEADLQLLIDLYTDPTFDYIDCTCFGAWGRRSG